jgi:hypothetical protein
MLVKYTYDALGRRMSKETSEYTVKYVYAMQDVVEETRTEKSTNESLKTEYIYGESIDDVVAIYKQENNSFTRREQNEQKPSESIQESLYFIQKDIR